MFWFHPNFITHYFSIYNWTYYSFIPFSITSSLTFKLLEMFEYGKSNRNYCLLLDQPHSLHQPQPHPIQCNYTNIDYSQIIDLKSPHYPLVKLTKLCGEVKFSLYEIFEKVSLHVILIESN